MPEPNRHYSIAGYIGLMIWAVLKTWWSMVIGFVVAFFLHIPLDWLFNECWERESWQTVMLFLVGGVFLVASLVVMCIVFGWLPAVLMFVAALGMDIWDGLPEVRKRVMENLKLAFLIPFVQWMPQHPIWPCHWGAPVYITVFGKQIKWYRDPWFKQENFWVTLVLACLSSALMIVHAYWTIKFHKLY